MIHPDSPESSKNLLRVPNVDRPIPSLGSSLSAPR
jgi:hypothetical protein